MDELKLDPENSSLENFTVERTGNKSVVIGADIIVNGTMYATSGEIALNGKGIKINGDFESEDGTISGDVEATVEVNGNGNIDTLKFTQGKEQLKQFKVNYAGEEPICLGSNLTIEDAIELTQGKLQIQNKVLKLGEDASINGANAQNYILMAQEGRLAQQIKQKGQKTEFPVGSLNGYCPVALELNENADIGEYQIGMIEDVLANGENGESIQNTMQVVKQTWLIECDASNIDLNMELNWEEDMQTDEFDLGKCYISHFFNGQWDATYSVQAQANANNGYMVQRDSIKSLSPFTVVSGDGITTSIKEVQNNELLVYPNPASDIINVQLDSKTTDAQIEIYNANGQLVLSQYVDRSEEQISIQPLSNGLYFYTITSNSSIVKKGELYIIK